MPSKFCPEISHTSSPRAKSLRMYPVSPSSTLSRRDRSSNRSAIACRSLFALIEILKDLSDVSKALCFIRGRFEIVESVWWLDENCVIDDNMGIRPTCW